MLDLKDGFSLIFCFGRVFALGDTRKRIALHFRKVSLSEQPLQTRSHLPAQPRLKRRHSLTAHENLFLRVG
jgi:hypothetical protein